MERYGAYRRSGAWNEFGDAGRSRQAAACCRIFTAFIKLRSPGKLHERVMSVVLPQIDLAKEPLP